MRDGFWLISGQILSIITTLFILHLLTSELSVIDFKSSTKEKHEDNIRNYFMQCSGYAEMFEGITNRPINKIVVAIATTILLIGLFVIPSNISA